MLTKLTHRLRWPLRRQEQLQAPLAGIKATSLTICLALLLLAKTGRGFAADDQVDYRKQIYREDDDRMSIDTDSLYFDLGIDSHVRVNGQLVIDAISGATPTGAPPQTQWPFQTFTGFYNQFYNQFLQAAINDPNNLNFFTSGLFGPTNSPAAFTAYTNFVAASNPQFTTQATNNAKQAVTTLSTNVNFHSIKVPLVQLHDLRRAGSVNFPITFGINTFTPGVSLSSESDYHSFGLAFNDSLQLNDKNTTLNAGWSHDADRVRDVNLAWEGKVSDDFLLGFTQLLTPKSYITVDFTFGNQYGYLTDPYRGVLTLTTGPQTVVDDASLTGENRPRHRTKEILYTSFNQFIDPLNGSAEVGYRFFHDSYGICAHTVEAAWHQKIGKYVVVTPSFRYYNQTAAFFYATIFLDPDTLPAYYSSDYRLSEFEAYTASINLNWRIHKHVSLDLGYSRYIMLGLDGITSPSAYPAANIFNIGGRVLF